MAFSQFSLQSSLQVEETHACASHPIKILMYVCLRITEVGEDRGRDYTSDACTTFVLYYTPFEPRMLESVWQRGWTQSGSSATEVDAIKKQQLRQNQSGSNS